MSWLSCFAASTQLCFSLGWTANFLASGLGDRLGIIPLLEVDAGFNILAGILAFIMIRKGTVTAPQSEIELTAEHDLLEVDTATS